MKLKRYAKDVLKKFLKNRPPAEPYDSEPHTFSGAPTLGGRNLRYFLLAPVG